MKRETVFNNVGLEQSWAILKNSYSQFTIEGGKRKDKSDLGFTTLTFFYLMDDEHFVSSGRAVHSSRDNTLTVTKTNGNFLKKFRH